MTNLTGRKLFEFYLNPSLTETWTDNFNLTTRNQQENYRTTLGIGGILLINGATTKASISSNAGLTYDSSEASEGWRLFPTVSAAVTQILSPRLTLTATDTYIKNDEPSQADTFGLNRQRRTFSSNSFGLSANWLIDIFATQFYYQNTFFSSGDTDTVANTFGANAGAPIGPLTSARVGYEYSTSSTTSDNASSNTNDSTIGAARSGHISSQTLYGSLSRQLGQFSSAGISSSYTMQEQDNARIWNVSLFSTYGLPSGLSLSSSIGYSLLTSDSQPNSGGITTNSSLSYRFTRAVVALSAFRDFRQTGIEGQNFGIVETAGYSGTFLYTFTPFLSGNAQVSYTTNSATGVGNNSSSPDSNTLTAGAGLSWQMLRWLSSSLQYTYSLRSTSGNSANANSTVNGNGDVTVNTVTLFLVGAF